LVQASNKMSGSKPRTPSKKVPTEAAPWYDEFAIGWNEIFDAAPSQPLGGSSVAKSSGAAAVSGELQASGSSVNRRLPPAEDKNAFWSSEVLTSKKPPAYLRLGSTDTRESAIDIGIKMRLMDYPKTQLRKEAEVMEVELEQLRNEISDAHVSKRKDARRSRRLGRRCRVKAHEDLDALEARFADGTHLSPLADPAEKAEAWKPSKQTTKSFFVNLGKAQVGGETPVPGTPKSAQSAH